MNMTTVYELEHKILPEEEWGNIPQIVSDALGEPWEEAAKSVPLGIGHTEETGWFIVMSGQGPFIFWMEKEDEGTYGHANDGRRDHWTRKHSP
jgi:hypothetical protein